MIKLSAAACRVTGVLRLAGAAGLLATGVTTGMLLPAAAAGAAVTASPARPVSTESLSFSCALTSYGITDPIVIDATQIVPKTTPADKPFSVTLSTQPVSLPAALSGQLPALKDISLSADSEVSKGIISKGGTNGTAPYSGKSAPVSAGAATLPAITAQATLAAAKTGPAFVATVAAISLTPVGLPGQPVTAATIECASSAGLLDVPITVSSPPMPTPPPMKHSGPTYRCRLGPEGSLTMSFPMRITVTGPGEVAARDRVQLAISPPEYVGPGMRSAVAAAGGRDRPPRGITLAAALPVTGAQPGTLHVAGMNKLTAYRLKAAGELTLTTAGQDTILLPSRFQWLILIGHHSIPAFTCTLKAGHDPAGATLTVTGSATDGSGTPIGAPNTGGGTGRPAGFSWPLVLGGTAALLGGAALSLTSLRRRRKQQHQAAA